MSQALPGFNGRNTFAPSSKLPDRTGFGTSTNPQTFAQSAFARRPDTTYQFPQASIPPQHGPLPIGGRQTMEKETSALNDLSEEQREEINEAVGVPNMKER